MNARHRHDVAAIRAHIEALAVDAVARRQGQARVLQPRRKLGAVLVDQMQPTATRAHRQGIAVLASRCDCIDTRLGVGIRVEVEYPDA